MAHITLCQSWKGGNEEQKTSATSSHREGLGLASQEKPRLPDVGMSGEDAVLEGLGGHPAHGQQAFPSFPVIVSLIDVSRHAKICEVREGTRVTLSVPPSGKAKVRRHCYTGRSCAHVRGRPHTRAGHQCLPFHTAEERRRGGP